MCDFGDGGSDGGDISSFGDGFDVFEIFGPRRDNFLLRICLGVGMVLLFICLTPFGYIIFPEWIRNLFESVFDYGLWMYVALVVALVVVLIGIIVTALYFVLRFLKRLYWKLL
ncbi:hypothetical protein [Succinimonas sp.]|uniref:hypothetical protein n=1 Tax=Succinimonas sp. TaxID=1936151 RepID=UPI003863E61B